MLAVLPNSPSLIYPGKQQELLLEKRNRLLDHLWHEGILDSLDCSLAKDGTFAGSHSPFPMRLPTHSID